MFNSSTTTYRAGRRKAARRELANLGSYYLADLGIERDQVDVAVEGLLRIAPADAPASQKRLDWRRLFGCRAGLAIKRSATPVINKASSNRLRMK